MSLRNNGSIQHIRIVNEKGARIHFVLLLLYFLKSRSKINRIKKPSKSKEEGSFFPPSFLKGRQTEVDTSKEDGIDIGSKKVQKI